ncbi:hypothetical protein R1sor_020997 [Riccia sorocarpa]|uniref:Uncharacterized protein n=1 Tax=Riccia sorocarpa TaxID=122646 RepID=A0ABD3GJG2_9MARC
MDIYLEPLVEELKLFWEDVRAYDASSRCPRENMTMIDYLVLEAEIQVGEVPRASFGLNQISISMELPYWDGLLVQHLGDVMHEEGNVMKNLLQHIWGKADTIKHRRACEEFGMHPAAWLYIRPNGAEAIPPAEWVLSAHDKRLFIEPVQLVKCPTGYGSNFRMAFTHEDTWTWGKGLKTHDLHKLLQDIIPIVMVDLGNDRLRKAIWALSKLLRWVCNKEVAESLLGFVEFYVLHLRTPSTEV